MLAQWNTADVLEATGELVYTEGIAHVGANGEYTGDVEPIGVIEVTFEGMPVKIDTNGELFVRAPGGPRIPVQVRIVVERAD